MTVADYYKQRFPYKEQDVWLNGIKEGRIRLNGVPVKPTDVLPEHAIIDSLVTDIIEPPINADWDEIYEDEDLIVINKPGHLAVHPTGRFFKHSYVELMRERRPEIKVRMLHRLDLETSGVLLVGKTNRIATAFLRMFNEKLIQKEYLALVYGKFPKETVEVDAPIGNNIDSIIGVKMQINGRDAKDAKSKFDLLEERGKYSLIRCRPITGRTNQLRVHLEHIGYPILGDKMYCNNDQIFNDYHEFGETDELKSKLVLYRQALHAWKVHFEHPISKENVTFTAPFPQDIDLK